MGDELLTADLLEAEERMLKRFPFVEGWESPRYYAMLDLCFNMGAAKVARFNKFLTAAKKQDWPTACLELRRSKWYRQVGDRAKRVIQWMAGKE